MKLFTKLFILTATVTALSGCRADLLDTKPYDKAASSSMWSNENLCQIGVAGVYSQLRDGYVAKEAYLMENYGVGSTCRDNDYDLLRGTASTGTSIFVDYWKQHYEGIQRANDAIANLATAPISESVKGKLIAESKVLRAFFYYKLNAVFKGVPYYDVPIAVTDPKVGRSTEEEIWAACLKDLTDAINESNLPDRNAAGKAEWGHVTKSVAYALRGKVYLWIKDWTKAEADLRKVGDLGHKLFDGGYKQLFKEANEQSDEAIFSLQCVDNNGKDYGNAMSFRYGGRTTFGSCWNTMLASTDFVESYENADGSKFDWDQYIPEYSSLSIDDREVFFLRNTDTEMLKAEFRELGYTGTEKDLNDAVTAIQGKVAARLALLSAKAQALYSPTRNEARIKKAYASRDPRLAQTFITPYALYNGSGNSIDHTFTSRWPYYGADTTVPFDMRTDTQSHFYYLFRKFVAEGSSEMTNREQSPIDLPIIRYATVALGLAEALNEQGKTDDAIEYVNKVRARAGVALLNSNAATTVKGKDDMRTRIQNEFRWETAGEGVNFYEEIRWKTWKESKFNNADGTAGMKEVWGSLTYKYTWGGDQYYAWPIPKHETDMNKDLIQNTGWE